MHGGQCVSVTCFYFRAPFWTSESQKLYLGNAFVIATAKVLTKSGRVAVFRATVN